MTEETKSKITDLINSLYDAGYIENNDFLNSRINWTDDGQNFMKEKWGDLWSKEWPNCSHTDRIWLPRLAAKDRLNDAREHRFDNYARDYWEYAKYSYWNNEAEERLDLLIDVLELYQNDNYIDLDDIIL